MAKRGPLKVYQSGLRLLWGTGDFKGHIPFLKCIRYQGKFITVTAAGPCCHFRWDKSTEPPIPFITENGRGRPRSRKRREEKRQGIPRCWSPSREALWQTSKSLKDKARGICLICRQAGYWAKECPNHGKSPKMACYKCHELGHWAALCPWDPRASKSGAKPSLTVVQQDWSSPIQPAHLSQVTITVAKGATRCGSFENFTVDTGSTYSVLTSYFWAFSSKTCTILGATGKTITERFTWAFLCCWDGQIFSH